MRCRAGSRRASLGISLRIRRLMFRKATRQLITGQKAFGYEVRTNAWAKLRQRGTPQKLLVRTVWHMDRWQPLYQYRIDLAVQHSQVCDSRWLNWFALEEREAVCIPTDSLIITFGLYNNVPFRCEIQLAASSSSYCFTPINLRPRNCAKLFARHHIIHAS